ncbi:hypothetical protein Emag_007362 [Eimeria magna]
MRQQRSPAIGLSRSSSSSSGWLAAKQAAAMSPWHPAAATAAARSSSLFPRKQMVGQARYLRLDWAIFQN